MSNNSDNWLNTDSSKGLSSEEVKIRQNEAGKNKLKEAKAKSWFVIYLEQFKDLMVILLLVATLISFGLAIYEGIHTSWVWNTSLTVSFIEPFIILFVVMTNAIVGMIQEIKSQKAVEALKNMSPLTSKVIRDGQLRNINSEDLVVGDIMIIESGDIVGADGILLDSQNLFCIESSLTGESVASAKDFRAEHNFELPIADQDFKVFSSSAVSNGRGVVLVTQIGNQTEIGKISKMLSEQENQLTPLQLKINKLGKIFGIGGIVLFAVSLIIQFIFQAIANKSGFSEPSFWSSSLVNSISLAVAAIPEGLVAFTTIILSLSVRAMAKQKAIVKSLMAVETLGSTAVICSDKTGTLTQNKMTVVDYYDASTNSKMTESQNNDKFKILSTLFALCTDANLAFKEDGQIEEVGDPTETALLYAVKNITSRHASELKNDYQRVKSFPFDSDRKLMSTINIIEGKHFLIVKGAPEMIFNLVNDKNVQEYEQINSMWAQNGFRVLGLATRRLTDQEVENLDMLTEQNLEHSLDFKGLVAMIDPPRQSSKEAIAKCKKAGIKPVMITGDNLVTAIAIAKDLGIYKDGDLAITGKDLESLGDDELFENIERYSVFARVAPKDKIRIVKMWQQKDQVVAMTGDGVNDAPALKASDIGCAMGITGTEVSKQAADLILVDDNFATVVNAVENGRSIYQRIRNVIQNLLITSIAEIVLVFFGILIFRAIFNTKINEISAADPSFEFFILSATQLLWINLFTHGFPAIALGLQETKENYMNQRPYSKFESIFARQMGWNTLWQGIFIGILSLVGYYLGAAWVLYGNVEGMQPQSFVNAGSTVAFLVIGIGATFNTLNLMSTKSVFISNPLYYWKVYASVIFSIFFLLLVTYVTPIATVFNLLPEFAKYSTLNGYAYGLIAIIIPIYFIHKLITNYIQNQKNQKNQITDFVLIKRPKPVFKFKK
ncbi:cation-translocating P-type ATPase [[Mycoplasma] gypis]|uniref:Cation-transporting P-type ATPase n=1 Tax=[Mycoplasma] gypis TaxID=92404 RepID=A0ABZ2RQV6_9BACT|nr:cation-transporting P-type ATPase [[Mycoplasma] gypis]MBN0919329.1 cation-transporting P-type ATPase [[Mycoplasma] gypis]